MSELPQLDEHYFLAGIFLGLSQRGYSGIRPPELGFNTDHAAVAAYKVIDEKYTDVIETRFFIATDPVYHESSTWRSALHGCVLRGYAEADTLEGYLRFHKETLEDTEEYLPGTDEMWNEATDAFLRALDGHGTPYPIL